MRAVYAYILRLLIDSEHPETLRGVLRSVANGATYPFANEAALLALLHRLVGSSSMPPGAERAPHDSPDPEPSV